MGGSAGQNWKAIGVSIAVGVVGVIGAIKLCDVGFELSASMWEKIKGLSDLSSHGELIVLSSIPALLAFLSTVVLLYISVKALYKTQRLSISNDISRVTSTLEEIKTEIGNNHSAITKTAHASLEKIEETINSKTITAQTSEDTAIKALSDELKKAISTVERKAEKFAPSTSNQIEQALNIIERISEAGEKDRLYISLANQLLNSPSLENAYPSPSFVGSHSGAEETT